MRLLELCVSASWSSPGSNYPILQLSWAGGPPRLWFCQIHTAEPKSKSRPQSFEGWHQKLWWLKHSSPIILPFRPGSADKSDFRWMYKSCYKGKNAQPVDADLCGRHRADGGECFWIWHLCAEQVSLVSRLGLHRHEKVRPITQWVTWVWYHISHQTIYCIHPSVALTRACMIRLDFRLYSGVQQLLSGRLAGLQCRFSLPTSGSVVRCSC